MECRRAIDVKTVLLAVNLVLLLFICHVLVNQHTGTDRGLLASRGTGPTAPTTGFGVPTGGPPAAASKGQAALAPGAAAGEWCTRSEDENGPAALEGFCEQQPPWYSVCMRFNPSTDKCHPARAPIETGNPWHNGHRFEALYPLLLDRHRNRPGFTLLEIGTANGGSLALWEKYFTTPRMYFVELDPAFFAQSAARVPAARGFHGSATDCSFMLGVLDTIPEPLDMVIDDSSHRYPETFDTFRLVFPRLRSGGIYIIEDLNCCYTKEGRIPNSVCTTAAELVDVLNRRNWGDGEHSLLGKVDHDILSVQFADEIVAIYKR